MRGESKRGGGGLVYWEGKREVGKVGEGIRGVKWG